MKPVQEGNRPADKYRVPVFNQSSEAVPPYGAMQVASSSNVGDDKVFNTIKPNGAPTAKVYLNGPVSIPANQHGFGTDEYPAEALIAGTPAFGAELGPIAASWALSASGKGFQYLGGLASGVGRVAAKGGTTAGDDFPLVKIVNASGLPRAFGNIVGFGAPVDPPPGTLHRIPTFLSAAPEAGKPFAVLLHDIAVGATGDAGPMGLVLPALLNFSDASHSRADAINGNFSNLQSAVEGPALILWREKQGIVGGGTLGLQWSRLLFGQPLSATHDIRGVTTGIIGAATGQRDGPIIPGTGQVRLYTMPTSGNAGSTWQPGQIVTVENWMRGQIASFKPVLLKPSRKDSSGNIIYIVHAEGCEEIPSG
jgi:hypothetical protein